MPGRHSAPRHKSSRSVSRSLGRLATDAVSAVPKPGVTSAVAVVGATGMALGIGVLSTDEETAATSSTNDAAPVSDEVKSWLAARSKAEDADVSRSGERPVTRAVQRETKTRHLAVTGQDMGGQVTRTVEPSDPRDIAALMMAEDYGWGSDQYSCLDSLYISESDWDHTATNPTSGAYGIPQSLPAEKMATAGADWRSNPETQIAWGLEYIAQSYGTPCSAWAFKSANNWY